MSLLIANKRNKTVLEPRIIFNHVLKQCKM